MNPAPEVTSLPVEVSMPVKVALFAIRFYKVNLATWYGGSCRFQPTCSQYVYEAIERFGLRKGSWLGLRRLARCHPFSGRFGFDPVSECAEQTGVGADGVHS